MSIPKDKIEKAAVSVHIGKVLIASRVVQDFSISLIWVPSSPDSNVLLVFSPSGSKPMSSGSLTRKSNDNGTIIPIPINARITHDSCQVYLSINTCVSGTKTTAPAEIPAEEYAKAFPRFLTNHFVGGTEVAKDPGPLIPTSPITANVIMSCHDDEVYFRPIMQRPVITAADTRIHFAPYLSKSLPMNGPVIAPVALLAEEAQPNDARPILSSSPIGLIYKPKFRDPMPMVTAPTTAITATITHP